MAPPPALVPDRDRIGLDHWWLGLMGISHWGNDLFCCWLPVSDNRDLRGAKGQKSYFCHILAQAAP